MKALPYVIGAGATVGVGALLLRAFTADVHTLKDLPPDYSPPPPGKTGHHFVDALLPKLREMASNSNIPLGLLVGWIVKESGGKLAKYPQPGPGDTSMDERGYFQLTPDESQKLGLDHQRLSTDSDYSLAAGPLRIRECEAATRALNVPAAQPGTAFYWLLVKLQHTVGSGQTKKWVEGAKAAGKADSWGAFEAYVLGERWRGPQPKKWFPFMDDLYRVGKPFGFGDASSIGPAVAGVVSTGLIGIDVFVS